MFPPKFGRYIFVLIPTQLLLFAGVTLLIKYFKPISEHVTISFAVAGGIAAMVANHLAHSRTAADGRLNAEFLLYLFLDPTNCDAIVGDLEERYRKILGKFGKHRANFWYWTQAIRSVWPIAWAWAKKTTLKPLIGVIAWAVAKGLLDRDSWVAAFVELFRRIRS